MREPTDGELTLISDIVVRLMDGTYSVDTLNSGGSMRVVINECTGKEYTVTVRESDPELSGEIPRHNPAEYAPEGRTTAVATLPEDAYSGYDTAALKALPDFQIGTANYDNPAH